MSSITDKPIYHPFNAEESTEAIEGAPKREHLFNRKVNPRYQDARNRTLAKSRPQENSLLREQREGDVTDRDENGITTNAERMESSPNSIPKLRPHPSMNRLSNKQKTGIERARERRKKLAEKRNAMKTELQSPIGFEENPVESSQDENKVPSEKPTNKPKSLKITPQRMERLNSMRQRSPTFRALNSELKRNLNDASVVMQEEKASSIGSDDSSRSSLSAKELGNIASKACKISANSRGSRSSRLQNSVILKLKEKRTQKLATEDNLKKKVEMEPENELSSQNKSAFPSRSAKYTALKHYKDSREFQPKAKAQAGMMVEQSLASSVPGENVDISMKKVAVPQQDMGETFSGKPISDSLGFLSYGSTQKDMDPMQFGGDSLQENMADFLPSMDQVDSISNAISHPSNDMASKSSGSSTKDDSHSDPIPPPAPVPEFVEKVITSNTEQSSSSRPKDAIQSEDDEQVSVEETASDVENSTLLGEVINVGSRDEIENEAEIKSTSESRVSRVVQSIVQSLVRSQIEDDDDDVFSGIEEKLVVKKDGSSFHEENDEGSGLLNPTQEKPADQPTTKPEEKASVEIAVEIGDIDLSALPPPPPPPPPPPLLPSNQNISPREKSSTLVDAPIVVESVSSSEVEIVESLSSSVVEIVESSSSEVEIVESSSSEVEIVDSLSSEAKIVDSLSSEVEIVDSSESSEIEMKLSDKVDTEASGEEEKGEDLKEHFARFGSAQKEKSPKEEKNMPSLLNTFVDTLSNFWEGPAGTPPAAEPTTIEDPATDLNQGMETEPYPLCQGRHDPCDGDEHLFLCDNRDVEISLSFAEEKKEDHNKRREEAQNRLEEITGNAVQDNDSISKCSTETSSPESIEKTLSEEQLEKLEQFSTTLKQEGIEVMKQNRYNQWQLRYLTVSKEFTQTTSKENPIQCPKALLWLKQFDATSSDHSIETAMKQGRGGLLFSDLLNVKEENDDIVTSADRFLTKKLKAKFPSSHAVKIEYGCNGGKNRSLLLRFKSEEDATMFVAALNIMRGAVGCELGRVDTDSSSSTNESGRVDTASSSSTNES